LGFEQTLKTTRGRIIGGVVRSRFKKSEHRPCRRLDAALRTLLETPTPIFVLRAPKIWQPYPFKEMSALT
jgi:hypothetical protein